jgi:hypothetical protein
MNEALTILADRIDWNMLTLCVFWYCMFKLAAHCYINRHDRDE